MELMHYPTERIIFDYFTKSLNVSLFKKMREIVMGLTNFPEEERVGNCQKMSIISSGSVIIPGT